MNIINIYKCNIYIVTTSALYFKQLYMFYKLDPIIKRIYLFEKIPYLPHTFNCSSYTLPSLCFVSLGKNA